MKTVKTNRPVIHGGKIVKAGEVIELEDAHAEHLIEGEHAREHKTRETKAAPGKAEDTGKPKE
jgi:hypothetical protein